MELTILTLIPNELDRANVLAILKKSPVFSSDVVEAIDAAHAIDALKQQNFDIVISDIELSGFDGWRLVRLIRSGLMKTTADTAVIMMPTLWCEQIVETTANEFGVTAVVPKNQANRLPGVIKNVAGKNNEMYHPKLLVIEDNRENAILIDRALSNRFDIDLATTGEIGLETWKAGSFDLVLLDLMLPGIHGDKVLAQMMSANPHQTVVIMTAYGHEEVAASMMLAGASDFITKPFKPNDLRRICELAAKKAEFLTCNEQYAKQLQHITERKLVYRQLSKKHQVLLDNLSTIVMELDEKGSIVFVNDAWERMFGIKVQDTLGTPLINYIADVKKKSAIFQELSAPTVDAAEYITTLSVKGGTVRTVSLNLKQFESIDGSREFSCCIDDITDEVHAKKSLEHLAMHDALTGLHNRRYFEQQLSRVLVDINRSRTLEASLIFFDIDHFKVVNDIAGYLVGDELLCQVADIITDHVREGDVLCRIDGDAFAVLLKDTTVEHSVQFTESVKETVESKHFYFRNADFDISLSCGIAPLVRGIDTISSPISNADRALLVAKTRGRNQAHIYSPDDEEVETFRSQVNWVNKIRTAIKCGQLVFHYQPVVSSRDGEIEYYEALVRYRNEEGKLVPPGMFIPALENAFESILLDYWAIENTFITLSQHPKIARLGVNLSAGVFDNTSFIECIRKLLLQYNVAPNRIVLEITESASFKNLQSAYKTISKLRNMGFLFAIDDFGTGFSTFGYLKDIPSDYIKLDGSFIQNIVNSELDQTVVRSLVEVGRLLNRKTIAEFVEDEASQTLLNEMGVDLLQGFYLSKPAPIENIPH